MAVNEAKLLSAFLKASGFTEDEISGSNAERFTFVTHAGGKYQLSRDGKSVRRLMGPAFPSEAVPAAPEETESTEE